MENDEMPDVAVTEIMITDLFTLTPDSVVGGALRLVASKRREKKRITHFLVIEEGSLTGIVGVSDLNGAKSGALVGTCMKSPVLCVPPETTRSEALDIMEEHGIGCLPVVTGAFLVGMVTRHGLTGEAPPDIELTSVPLGS